MNDTAPVKRCGSEDYCCESPSNDCCDFAADRFKIEVLSDTRPTDQTFNPPTPQAPVGGIIGGVVGGLFVITTLVPLIWCLLRRKRAAKRKLLKDELEDKSKTCFDPSLAEADAGPGSVLVELDARTKTTAEADAGPDSVLVESDAQAIKPKIVHELPA